jgi:hypothetical protein
MFSATWGDAAAQCMCSHLQLAEGSFGFEITVHGVYVVLGFCLFLGSGGNAWLPFCTFWCFIIFDVMSRGVAGFSVHSAMSRAGSWIPD